LSILLSLHAENASEAIFAARPCLVILGFDGRDSNPQMDGIQVGTKKEETFCYVGVGFSLKLAFARVVLTIFFFTKSWANELELESFGAELKILSLLPAAADAHPAREEIRQFLRIILNSDSLRDS
jgi:hypothetical protein